MIPTEWTVKKIVDMISQGLLDVDGDMVKMFSIDRLGAVYEDISIPIMTSIDRNIYFIIYKEN